jgi:hypothetical protein
MGRAVVASLKEYGSGNGGVTVEYGTVKEIQAIAEWIGPIDAIRTRQARNESIAVFNLQCHKVLPSRDYPHGNVQLLNTWTDISNLQFRRFLPWHPYDPSEPCQCSCFSR